MVNIIAIRGGFGIFQNIQEKRLTYYEFIQLLELLKISFRYSYFEDLYENQNGYVFYTTENELKTVITYFKSEQKSAS